MNIGDKVRCIDIYCAGYDDIGEITAVFPRERWCYRVKFPPNPTKYPEGTVGHTNYHEANFMPQQLTQV